MSDEHQKTTRFNAPSIQELDNLLDGYRFESIIDQNEMGAVYLANQISLDRQVAVRVLPQELGEDEEFRKSFQSGAKQMAKLNHPNLIGIYDFGDIDGMLYIIMEFVKGKSLHRSAHGKAIVQKIAVEIVCGTCSGLAHAHKAGILHRDIKPSNILLGKKAIPKIGDFGLTNLSGQDGSGAILGTSGYAAPEVLEAPDKVDARTDVFATGVMLYELLTGQMPKADYVSVTEFADSDARLDEIIKKAIHPDMERRHSSAQDLADEITEVLATPATGNKLLVSKSSNTTPLRTKVAQKEEKEGSNHPPATVIHTVPVNSTLIRNIVIIFLLLGAIYAVLEMKEAKTAKVAETQRIIDEDYARTQKENSSHKAAVPKKPHRKTTDRRPKNTNTGRNTNTNTSSPKIIKLTPMEQLAKAKRLLADGERPLAMMPDTVFMRDQDSRMIMFIDKKMTWDKADAWASEHGGYLSICRSKSDLTALTKQMPDGVKDVWLGAGCSGDKGWSWVDDTPWTDAFTLKPTYHRMFAKLSKYGSISTTKANKKFNFFIEWRADGTNPAELASRLFRTSDTLGDINPKYPPGTITVGSRNYYIIKSPMKFADADTLANASGGHLIAISNDQEKYQAEDIIGKYFKSGNTIWTAAEKRNNIWGWQTGEEWLPLTWASSHPKEGKHVVFTAGSQLTIKDVPANTKADSFIIEWSKDNSEVEVITGQNSTSEELNSGLSALKNKAKIIVTKQLAATEKRHEQNVKKLWRDLESYMRFLPKSVQLQESGPINEIILKVKDKQRVPVDIAGEGPSKKAKDHTYYAVKKQGVIDTDHRTQMEALRTGYLKQLKELKTKLEKKGQTSAAKLVGEEIKNIGSTSAKFAKHFSE